MDDAQLKRLLRLGDMRPTARERWQAFYRLWRLARRGDEKFNGENAIECFYVLMADWRAIQLVHGPGDELAQWRPLELRRYSANHRWQRRMLQAMGKSR